MEEQNKDEIDEHSEEGLKLHKERMFDEISPDNAFEELTSLCMACGETGVTRLLLTKIPFFKVIETS